MEPDVCYRVQMNIELINVMFIKWLGGRDISTAIVV
jgi:hypothetical protein